MRKTDGESIQACILSRFSVLPAVHIGRGSRDYPCLTALRSLPVQGTEAVTCVSSGSLIPDVYTYRRLSPDMSRQVLVPVDASEQSTAALEFAIDNYPEATIVALHAIDPGDFPSGGFEAGAFTDFERFREN